MKYGEITGCLYKNLGKNKWRAIEFFDLIDNDESICTERKGNTTLISLNEEPDDSILSEEEMEIVKIVCEKVKNGEINLYDLD